MKLRSVFGALVAFGAMALMAVGVQAATYSAGASSPEAGVASIPVIVTPDEGESDVKVSGYVMTLTYDSTKVTPKVSATKDATDADCYATVDPVFGGDNTVLVSDIVATDGDNKTLAVAWASSAPVSVSDVANMATVEFEVADTATGDVPITVAVTALTNDGTTNVDASTITTANGEINIADAFKYGDINEDGAVDSFDANMALKHYSSAFLTARQITIGDVDGNGIVDSFDANLILKKYSDSTFVFPVEQ
ncbi:MAG: dockerin type I repeat-containing protein [Clostridia bacterium]|nr:dockerin type I repeat-containing protein [Clostridia bacterium]